ncbi:hypothetical protein ABT294_08190 [Nonomuraea sp. NPDC000554]|uniref:hypothetical protein n=1 Tax=Nonomuraea sp. NPDC000554 TaxID=3154259 RepID=UPI0033178D7F
MKISLMFALPAASVLAVAPVRSRRESGRGPRQEEEKMGYKRLVSAMAGTGVAFALLTVPAATANAETSVAKSGAQAADVHRKSAACASPRGKKITASWGDGNVSTTVYFNNHCNQKRTIELQFVSQRDVFWKCITVNPRTQGRKKIGYSNPNKVLLTKSPTYC